MRAGGFGPLLFAGLLAAACAHRPPAADPAPAAGPAAMAFGETLESRYRDDLERVANDRRSLKRVCEVSPASCEAFKAKMASDRRELEAARRALHSRQRPPEWKPPPLRPSWRSLGSDDN
ncbi:MAG TPA: hypothetical protein VNI01_07990 [Elusimicrobiota bacterium]|jgi:hypothetical protein|nr:hypothetical protein [Elusimicrobiota bacterium]